MPARPARLAAVVDDDDDARAAATEVLATAGYTVRRYATAREAVAAARTGALPRLVFMDMHLPGESAGRAIAAIRRADAAALIVALTSHTSDAYVFEALRAGAVGYVIKAQALDELADVAAMVERGGSPLSPGVARRVLAELHDDADRFEPLSPREQQILACFADGAGYHDTAERLGISVDTVRTHVRRLYAKLRVKNRAQAVLAALKRGLLGRR
jgi:DNA-binding NarL/FixJ family response regulator